ncbi:MAG: alpha/beta hydrolase [Humibacillus sp.]|nr:alpha/beta hydrolase [Humibacillus sp.]
MAIAICGSLLLSGSAPSGGTGGPALSPVKAEAIGLLLHQGVRYSDEALLDVYTAPATPSQPAGSAIVVLLHGCCGDRSDLGKLAEAISATGLVVVNVDWEGMDADARFPASYEGVACALGYTQALAGDLGADPRRVILVGWSDGAMAAAAVAAAGRQFSLHGCHAPPALAAPVAVVGIAGFYGWPVPVPNQYVLARSERFFGGDPHRARQSWAAATPYSWLASAPPTHLFVGTTDPLVDDARRYAAGLRAAGRSACVIEIPPGGDQTLISPRSTEGRRVVSEIASIADNLPTSSEGQSCLR